MDDLFLSPEARAKAEALRMKVKIDAMPQAQKDDIANVMRAWASATIDLALSFIKYMTPETEARFERKLGLGEAKSIEAHLAYILSGGSAEALTMAVGVSLMERRAAGEDI